ncbi:MAG: GntR family transcriptional regulator [Burkholderiaceae bacterium]
MSSIPNPGRPESLAQQGYEVIRRAIRDGKIARGQLFSESTLAESLGVSRTPVREALLNLFRDGVVEIVPKRGYRLVDLDEAAISEIRMLRVALEKLVVGRLCEIATPEHVRELRTILKGRGESREDMYGIDEAFHTRMAELAGLHQIRRALLSVRGKMYLIASGTQVTALRNEEVVREHAELLDAIEQHDGRRAKRLITEHVGRSIDAFAAARARMLKQQRLEPIG